MNRRNFFRWLGVGAAAPVIAKALPELEKFEKGLLKEIQPAAKPEALPEALPEDDEMFSVYPTTDYYATAMVTCSAYAGTYPESKGRSIGKRYVRAMRTVGVKVKE